MDDHYCQSWPASPLSRKENSTVNYDFSVSSLFQDNMTAVMGFSKKKMEKRLFYFQNDRSGRPVLTPGKRPYVMPVSFF